MFTISVNIVTVVFKNNYEVIDMGVMLLKYFDKQKRTGTDYLIELFITIPEEMSYVASEMEKRSMVPLLLVCNNIVIHTSVNAPITAVRRFTSEMPCCAACRRFDDQGFLQELSDEYSTCGQARSK